MTSRRTFLVAGAAAGTALAVAWWLRARVGAPAAGEAGTEALFALDAEAPAIVAAIAPVILDGALPAAATARAEALRATVAGVSEAVAGLPPFARKELSELFALLAFAPARVALARVGAPWRDADRADVAAFLERWRMSRFALLRSAYDALHQLVLAAWYANPQSWPATGYPGPPALLG